MSKENMAKDNDCQECKKRLIGLGNKLELIEDLLFILAGGGDSLVQTKLMIEKVSAHKKEWRSK